jgi:ribonuclease D
VFSFSEDLRLLHSLGCFPRGLFDLQVAGGLLNFPPSSLASLSEQVLEFQISKSSQQSNWFQRPLTEKQLNYAVQDVIYLPQIYQLFKDEFENRGIQTWIEEEMNHFESDNHEDANQNDLLKEKYKADLNEVEWHIFSELMQLRESHAMKINRPPYHVAERRTLTDIAKDPVKSSDWMNISSNHRSTKTSDFVEKLKVAIDSSIKEAKQLGLSSRKRAAKRPSKEEYEKWKATEMKVKFAKQTFFKPIQKCIDQEYGEYVKTMILNNRLIKDLVTGHYENLLPYKKNVILQCANKLELDAQPYISNNGIS